jgi:hypothetical protein
MEEKMSSFFSSKSKDLQNFINKYIDVIEKCALVFEEGVKCYINWKEERFANYYKPPKRGRTFDATSTKDQ